MGWLGEAEAAGRRVAGGEGVGVRATSAGSGMGARRGTRGWPGGGARHPRAAPEMRVDSVDHSVSQVWQEKNQKREEEMSRRSSNMRCRERQGAGGRGGEAMRPARASAGKRAYVSGGPTHGVGRSTESRFAAGSSAASDARRASGTHTQAGRTATLRGRSKKRPRSNSGTPRACRVPRGGAAPWQDAVAACRHPIESRLLARSRRRQAAVALAAAAR